MIGKLTGIIDFIGEDRIILDVGGVGYDVLCSRSTILKIQPGSNISLLIDTHVREDHIHLYGFIDESEKKMFNYLQKVKGVGTRMALGILSILSPKDVVTALTLQDTAAFNRVSGVGNKLAQRIITELKDDSGVLASNFNIKDLSPLKNDANMNAGGNMDRAQNFEDAIGALMQLGVPRNDATNRVQKILSDDPECNLNNLITLALKNN